MFFLFISLYIYIYIAYSNGEQNIFIPTDRLRICCASWTRFELRERTGRGSWNNIQIGRNNRRNKSFWKLFAKQ